MEMALDFTLNLQTMKKNIILLFIIFNSLAAFAQVPVNNFNPKEKLYLQTLQQTVAYLKSKPTKYFDFHSTPTYNNDEVFYDTVITMFFNKERMLKNFEQKTEVFAVEGKVDIIRHILNGCDYNLDFMPADSIFVTPFRHQITDTLLTAEDSSLLNALEVYFMVDGKKISVLLCWFDADTNKFLGLSPSGSFDVNDDKIFQNFIRRQKKFYEYPIKRSLH
jgi:hypothetical protein